MKTAHETHTSLFHKRFLLAEANSHLNILYLTMLAKIVPDIKTSRLFGLHREYLVHGKCAVPSSLDQEFNALNLPLYCVEPGSLRTTAPGRSSSHLHWRRRRVRHSVTSSPSGRCGGRRTGSEAGSWRSGSGFESWRTGLAGRCCLISGTRLVTRAGETPFPAKNVLS